MDPEEFYTPIELEILDSIADEDIEAHDDISLGDGDSDAVDAVIGDEDIDPNSLPLDDSDLLDDTIGEDL